MNVLFIDYATPRPYTASDLSGCGGTEATVTRVAEALVRLGHDVSVEQRGREKDEGIYVGRYSGQPDVVIVLRMPALLPEIRSRFYKARLYLWAHDWANGEWASLFPSLVRARTQVVCVSQTHKMQMQMVMAPVGDLTKLPIHFIYPPISDNLTIDDTPVDKNKLVFFSSPHKGLKETLSVFKLLKDGFLPDVKLYVSNPGYYKSLETHQDGVVNLGSLSHEDVMSHVRSALCFFYINYVFPETFGLVYAEANAVGTPVIAHRFGAAHEVLSARSQVVDARDNKQIIDRVLSWHQDGGRPKVQVAEKYRLKNVVAEWGRLLHGSYQFQRTV